MSNTKEKNVTIGKIVVAIIAIAVMFVPVFAVQQIEARSITHALEVEGLYVNGTGIQVAEFTNDTRDNFETVYAYTANETETYDSAINFRGIGLNKDIFYRDRITYTGNDTYLVELNYTDEPDYTYSDRNLFIPLDLNATELATPDFIRMTSTFTGRIPRIWVLGIGPGGGAVYGEPNGGTTLTVATDSYIWVNTLSTRSWLNEVAEECGDNTQVFIEYVIGTSDPDVDTFELKIQEETYTGADVLTWNDETLYTVGVVLCDILLIGAIIFASDPIDIIYDKTGKNSRK